MITNASNTPLDVATGTVPNVGGALTDWFQPMEFTTIVKQTVGFQVVEVPTSVPFRGVIQPLKARELLMKPEGQRAWTWYQLHATPDLKLKVDDIVTYRGVPTRVMALKAYDIYGYIEYELVQNWN